MGDIDLACEWLEKAISLDEKSRATARDDVDFDGMRGEACFKALVGEAGKGG